MKNKEFYFNLIDYLEVDGNKLLPGSKAGIFMFILEPTIMLKIIFTRL